MSVNVKKVEKKVIYQTIQPSREIRGVKTFNPDHVVSKPAPDKSFMDKTMQELSATGGWFKDNTPNKPNVISLPGTTDEDGKSRRIVPGQTYTLNAGTPEQYWIKFEDDACQFMSYQYLEPKYLCLSYKNQSPINNFEVQNISMARAQDILDNKPTISQLYTAGLKFCDIPEKVLNKSPFDITRSTPVW